MSEEIEFDIESVKILPVNDDYLAARIRTRWTKQTIYNGLSWAEFLSIALNDELLRSAEVTHLPEETGRFAFKCIFPDGSEQIIIVHDYCGGNHCLIDSYDGDAIMEFIDWLDEYAEDKEGIDFERSFTYRGKTYTIVYEDGELKQCVRPAWLESLGL